MKFFNSIIVWMMQQNLQTSLNLKYHLKIVNKINLYNKVSKFNLIKLRNLFTKQIVKSITSEF